MKIFFASFLTALTLSSTLIAQNNNTGGGTTNQGNGSGEEDGIKGFWECETSGGKFVARLNQISSVSEHTYLIDGSVRVYECTVGTIGGLVARFYYIEPVTDNSTLTTGKASLDRLRNMANKVTNKTGQGDIDTLVTKHYPDTTHAKTVEYRLRYKESIGQIYAHAHRVWAEEQGRGQKNKLKIIDG